MFEQVVTPLNVRLALSPIIYLKMSVTHFIGVFFNRLLLLLLFKWVKQKSEHKHLAKLLHTVSYDQLDTVYLYKFFYSLIVDFPNLLYNC